MVSLLATWLIALFLVPCTTYSIYKFGHLGHLKLLACSLLGVIFSVVFINGSLSVFLHELKHSVLSNLVGNRAKGMKVRRDSGHFEYEFTKETGRFNPFIALAPYFFPIITLPAALVAAALLRDRETLQLCLIGFCAGADLLICLRDISPHQTDFSAIRGGFKVGLAYVVAINIILWSLLLMWAVGALPHLGSELLSFLRSHK